MQTIAETNTVVPGLAGAPEPERRRRRRAWRRVAVTLRRWVRAMRRRRLEKRMYHELMELEDWQLRDIGLSRSDLLAVARGTFQGRRG